MTIAGGNYYKIENKINKKRRNKDDSSNRPSVKNADACKRDL